MTYFISLYLLLLLTRVAGFLKFLNCRSRIGCRKIFHARLLLRRFFILFGKFITLFGKNLIRNLFLEYSRALFDFHIL
jgi:hypothetical protein